VVAVPWGGFFFFRYFLGRAGFFLGGGGGVGALGWSSGAGWGDCILPVHEYQKGWGPGGGESARNEVRLPVPGT